MSEEASTSRKALRLAPKDTSPEEVKAHVEQLVEHIELSPETALILVKEIRNALAPAAMAAHHLGTVGGSDPECLADIQLSLDRITALTDAITKRLL